MKKAFSNVLWMLVAVAAVLGAAVNLGGNAAIIIGLLFVIFCGPARMVLATLIVIVGALGSIVNVGGQVGLGLGLLLGTFFGPARISGVDFRQWFRDPGIPSEIGDDSFIGLMRWGFHTLWAGWAAAIVVVRATASCSGGPCSLADPLRMVGSLPDWFHLRTIGTAALEFFVRSPQAILSWLPRECVQVDFRLILGLLPERFYLQAMGNGLHWLLTSCSGTPLVLTMAATVIVGASVMLGSVEAAWRLGLVFSVQPPARPLEYLTTHQVPSVPAGLKPNSRRRLVICCDGTWNWPESRHETNVVRLVRALKPVACDGIPQIAHYHEGVGTGNFLDRALGGGTGIGLTASVKACYGFLADNYREHDEIFLFGFSRGAYVVRSLAGFIGTVGMLRKHEMARFSEVWDWYWQDRQKRDRHTLSRLVPDRIPDVYIDGIGVWDTVGALGIPGSNLCASAFAFLETELGPRVRHAFQALAIDEQRGNFQGAVWVPYLPNRRVRGETAVAVRAPESTPANATPQVLGQMWFPGVHSNIGGGYTEHGLSDASYVWMLSQLQGLLDFDERSIVGALDPKKSESYSIGELVDSRTLFWKLLWCPVPRPVGIISDTEEVHASAWDRSDTKLVARSDIYKSTSRRAWLTAMGPRTQRSQFETRIDALPRPPQPAPIRIATKLGFCGRILRYLNPQS
jgi:hypothetical protein